MNKYILMLGVAAVSIGSYCAMASNSATMTVTATIAHDVSLTVTKDYNVGTITINPAYTEGAYCVSSDSDYSPCNGVGGIISITGTQWGRFTANVADSCKDNVDVYDCFNATPTSLNFGGITLGNYNFGYVSGNTFEFWYGDIEYDENTVPTSGDYSSEITINYYL
ncbi:MAG: hypothetical protein IJ689_05045 [Alphaproteobacteria bacterium]|nr:hypothetical protein [Alphaproteobacteria bacterium]